MRLLPDYLPGNFRLKIQDVSHLGFKVYMDSPISSRLQRLTTMKQDQYGLWDHQGLSLDFATNSHYFVGVVGDTLEVDQCSPPLDPFYPSHHHRRLSTTL